MRDTGVGMTRDEIAVALTPFAQVDASRSRWREGTGLGLPIAKALVQLHGGTLEIRSAKSLGTEVAVALPSRFEVSVMRGRDGSCSDPRSGTLLGGYDGTRDHARWRRTSAERSAGPRHAPIGRIVLGDRLPRPSCMLEGGTVGEDKRLRERPSSVPRWERCLPSTPTNTAVLAIVSALSVPVPAQREGERELWIAELGPRRRAVEGADGRAASFNRGVSVYPALGDRVRVASAQELELGVLRRQAATRCGSAASGRTLSISATDPRRRPARQAFCHSRNHRHGQVAAPPR